MATKIDVKGKYSRTDAFFLDPADIIVDSEINGRVDIGDVSEIKASILAQGQLQSVVVRKVEGNKLQLVIGFRRHAAISEINKDNSKEPIQIMAIIKTMSPEEAFVTNIIENIHRKNTTPMDDALNIVRFRDKHGKSDDQIATIYRRTSAWVNMIGRIASLPEEIQYKIHNGEIGRAAAYQLAIAPLTDKEKKELVTEAAQDFPSDIPMEPIGGSVKRQPKKDNKRKTLDKSISKKLRDKGVSSRARSLKEVRSFIESLDGPASSMGLQTLVKALLSYMGGKSDEKALVKVLDGLFDDEGE